MAIYKRGKTWWADFAVLGQRYRVSLKTTDWRKAQEQKKKLIAQAEAGKLVAADHHFGHLSFADAAEHHLTDRLARLAPRSIQTERERLLPLRKHLGAVAVRSITVELVRSYINGRREQGVPTRPSIWRLACCGAY